MRHGDEHILVTMVLSDYLNTLSVVKNNQNREDFTNENEDYSLSLLLASACVSLKACVHYSQC